MILLSSADIFKNYFFKNLSRTVLNCLDPDQDRYSVGPGPEVMKQQLRDLKQDTSLFVGILVFMSS